MEAVSAKGSGGHGEVHAAVVRKESPRQKLLVANDKTVTKVRVQPACGPSDIVASFLSRKS